jgi:ribosomal protein S20
LQLRIKPDEIDESEEGESTIEKAQKRGLIKKVEAKRRWQRVTDSK